jgi:EmrB/QacA subfamily drug resistance transporter
VICSAVSALIMLDSNIVAVSLPTIARSLHAPFTDIQWVIGAYVLGYTTLLLAAGNFADIKGRRTALIAGLATFAFASAGCGLAPDATALSLARAVQGAGGALMLTASLAIIGHDFSGERRARAIASWGAALGIALAVGPVLGGAVTSLFGWRWVFLVNVPIALVLIAGARVKIANSRDPDARRLDLGGITALSVALGMVIWTLIEGERLGWASLTTLLPLGASVTLLIVFVNIEPRQGHPMIDFALFKHRSFAGALTAAIGYGAGGQVMIFFLPQYLQNAYRLSPLAAGIAMLPFAMPMVLTPRYATGLRRIRSTRWLLVTGLATIALGDLLLSGAARFYLGYPASVVAMLVAGCGAGLLNGQTIRLVQDAVPADRAGMGGAIAVTTRFVGVLVAVAGLGAILSHRVRQHFVAAATSAGLPIAIADQASRYVTSGDLDRMLSMAPAPLHRTLSDLAPVAYASGFGAASLAAAAAAALTGLLVFTLVDSAGEASAPPETSTPVLDCRHPI